MAGVIRAARLPGRARSFTGSYEVGSFQPDRMPVTQWLDDAVPAIDVSTWMLRLRSGDVARSLTLQELSAKTEPVRATIDCTGGWFAEQDWEGVRLDRLLGKTTGRSVIARSVTGYWRRYPLGDARYLWLATRLGGMPLSAAHGAPARIVAPARRGFWWVKWVTSIEVSDTPWWWQPPFPVT
jgi:DMSO/TMAO reductase YedYZ molybdopterin-dependent catalytic subunit